jgi:hypothetical protein
MFVAKQKRNENLAEFILYMYQVEDLIRAFKFDMELIKTHIISKYGVKNDQLAEVTEWYSNLVLMMEKEGVVYSGHLQFLNNHIAQLNEVHLKLIAEDIVPEYSAVYKNCIGLINEFRLKGDATASDVGTCINAIYGYLLLKIQKKEITPATVDAIKHFAGLMRHLSSIYKQIEKGELEL